MEMEFLFRVGNISLVIILYVVILQRGNVLLDFRSYLSTGVAFVYSFFPYFTCLSFPKIFYVFYLDHACCCNIRNVYRYFQSHTTHTSDRFIV